MPPMHTRFRPGQSGNPTGRRKGVRNLMTDVKRTLATPVTVKERGRTRKRSTQEGVLMVLREKALRGDARALKLILELAAGLNSDPADIGTAQAMSGDAQAILVAYEADVMAGLGAPGVPGDLDPSARGRSSKKASE